MICVEWTVAMLLYTIHVLCIFVVFMIYEYMRLSGQCQCTACCNEPLSLYSAIFGAATVDIQWHKAQTPLIRFVVAVQQIHNKSNKWSLSLTTTNWGIGESGFNKYH